MVDLGFKDSKFTSSNKRYKNKKDLILERIDKCFANDSWVLKICRVYSNPPPSTHFDYTPLLVQLNKKELLNSNKPFRFKPTWSAYPTFPDVVHQCFGQSNPFLNFSNYFTLLLLNRINPSLVTYSII